MKPNDPKYKGKIMGPMIGSTDDYEEVQSLLGDDLELSGFQVRAMERILRSIEKDAVKGRELFRYCDSPIQEIWQFIILPGEFFHL